MIGIPKPPKRKKKNKQGEWYNIMHNEIVPQFNKWGIYSCELRLSGCILTLYLGFAHTKKRRNIINDEDMRRVVLACQPCHERVEYHSVENTGKTMTDYLEGVIIARENNLRAKGLL